ncbi:glycosyltransferase family A protein [Glaciihabitans sp. dw_435]|uniref:glycosyltransferase family 2 protein n=1 Tax=Glaciihabitans sp. dw_435 TaxID=2720081 RepID=UPI001BD427E4|nr:glycosyltransferase family A protein [Glaciihabitans sp. dw_435]
MTRISVIIPTLNDADMLERCLASLARQTRPADEIIVVDNGSTDASVAVATKWGACVWTERRPGITAASAAGFDQAYGDIIARCDADSRLPADWLEHVEDALTERPGAVAITGPGRFYDLSGARALLAQIFYMKAYFFWMHSALAHTALFGSNYAVRATVWRAVSDSVPRDDTEIHDDIDLSFRLDPSSDVIFDRSLVVGISGRPFVDAGSFGRRMSRAIHTLSLHWPAQLPILRWRHRIKDSTHTPGTPRVPRSRIL